MSKTDPDSRIACVLQGSADRAAATTRRPQSLPAGRSSSPPRSRSRAPTSVTLNRAVRGAVRELGTMRVSHNAPKTVLRRCGLLATLDEMENIVSDGIQVLVSPMPGYARTPDRDRRERSVTRSCAECSPPRLDTSSYKHRKATVEPVFAQNKFNRGFRRYVQRRGRSAVRSEWRLQAAVHNLRQAPQPLDQPGDRLSDRGASSSALGSSLADVTVNQARSSRPLPDSHGEQQVACYSRPDTCLRAHAGVSR